MAAARSRAVRRHGERADGRDRAGDGRIPQGVGRHGWPAADHRSGGEFCRRNFIRGYPSLFETPTQVAGQLETLFTYHLPDDYFNTVLPGVDAVTLEDVSATAKKYLKVGELTIVVVGDRSKIEPGLRELPVGKDLQVLRFDADFHLAPGEK